MTATALPTEFSYRAQTTSGEPIDGSIQASSLDDANQRLAALGLHILQIDPLVTAARPRRLSGDDFLTFNMQLAHLTTAGLPIEQGLRLIADDMRSARMAQTVRQVADELEAGQSLDQAFEKHAAEFPSLYGQLIRAGVRTGNLPAMLLNLGRHLELVAQLRAAIWKAVAYPIFVMLSLALVLGFLGVHVFPQFNMIFGDFHIQLPGITLLVIAICDFLQLTWMYLLAAIVFLILGLPLLWQLARRKGWDQALLEAIAFPLPVIGSALKRNLLARWCDALRLGIEAGLDLPGTLELAADAVGSPGLRRDVRTLIQSIHAGQPLQEIAGLRVLPATVTTVIALASKNNDLPAGLNTLSQMFQQQAELKMAIVPVVLTPVLILVMAMSVGIVVLAMFAPIIALIQTVSGPAH